MISVQYIHKDSHKSYEKKFLTMTDAKKYARRIYHTGFYFVTLSIGGKCYAF